MKKTLIILGIVIVLIALAVWAYLFFFGVPKSDDGMFAQFEGGSPANTSTDNEGTVDVGDTTLEGTPQRLKQLTIRPVAGASFVAQTIYYVEQGTGHIYAIDTKSGGEKLVSNTTIAGAREAVFSGDVSRVAITTNDAGKTKTVAGTVPKNSGDPFSGISLPLGASNVHFGSGTGTVLYTLTSDTSVSGLSYTLDTEKSTELFSIPLRDVRVLWGDPIYIYTIPTASQIGYLYEVKKGVLSPTAIPGGTALMAVRYGDGIVASLIRDETLFSIGYTNSGETFSMPLSFMSEKCVAHPTQKTRLFCGTPTDTDMRGFPDNWYKGAVSYTDLLWGVDTATSEAVGLADLLQESGREIDIKQMGINAQGTLLYFINKNDNTLWMFDTTI